MVYLAQTDTTVGFLSKDAKLLNAIKNRAADKPCIVCAAAFGELNTRVPLKHKNLVRRAKKTTFILKNGFSFRLIKDGAHAAFLRKTGWLYSTSANITGGAFDVDFAKSKADIVIEDDRGLYESKPSMILKLGNKRVKKVR
ncbi:MAG: Sua5 YciO YrdC YwlC family protein [Campylobacteraceae bacterium]|jgi:tRNA A37 threonylcarbamoyladenosine synthetase subunit TsaC/SUA5/YrdC|nr:Sua5 YciO YrdC YwlC family protein [Campylobacteraceae bacterium]